MRKFLIFFMILCGLCVFGVDLEKVQAKEAFTEQELDFVSDIVQGNLNAVSHGVVVEGMDPNMTYKGIPLLHYPAHLDDKNMAELLVSLGSEVGAKDQHGTTAADVARHSGNVQLARYLLVAEEGVVEGKTVQEKDFWEGLDEVEERGGGFSESFAYGVGQGSKGNIPWYFHAVWFAVVLAFCLLCYRQARNSKRSWLRWVGFTLFFAFLPLLCWVPYAILKYLNRGRG